jgi:hypothetical protein
VAVEEVFGCVADCDLAGSYDIKRVSRPVASQIMRTVFPHLPRYSDLRNSFKSDGSSSTIRVVEHDRD